MSGLGRLERVDLRDIWQSEAQHFTPWLAREDNLVLLGETLGIDLELEAVEQNVGPFRADILCKDTLSDRWVLVENQLERTDHTHLGQLMTYAAGLDAVTIVWIAARVADEHRAAMDWLNEITDSEVRFFALEVELWRIGGSPAAPKFNVVSKPNDWSRSTNEAKRAASGDEVTETKALQLEYWQTLNTLIERRNGPLKTRSGRPQHWQNYSVGRTGFRITASVNSRENRIRAELFMYSDDAKQFFHLLFEKRAEIESAFGQKLDWDELPGRKGARISLSKDGVDFSRIGDWERQHEWLAEHLEQFHRVFSKRVTVLNAEHWNEEPGSNEAEE
ncbi:DUF4268 domain-containing protein [Roseovarius sp. TE539]|uniref:DUF4268 domain-containing protein n=1 Tax=Roseovarius sp. TE539 TaxID=2249812 RepID=UPI000DE067E1|nr:DUF4268 domain-containing protein [Roseovarius sp. TE539]RBI77019.1 DUF4268 domain-containing protein [Roseovarius sp. TE539]